VTELVGRQLGQYEILEEIGRGGMATVYRANQTSMGRIVAVKVLPQEFMHDTNFLQRFTREVQIIAQLQHIHILPVHDFGEQDRIPYIVMAYMAGGTLAQKIKQGPMPLDEVARYVEQIGQGLDHAHGQGIIHRDFKPSNVLLDGHGNAFLTDFGIAKVSGPTVQLTRTGMAVGTPAYMAPEMFDAEREVTSSVDIYALGITLYQMLSGTLPYKAETPLQYIHAHVNTPIPDVRALRSGLAVGVQEVIAGAMAKTPDQRYANAGAMARDLAAAARVGDDARPTRARTGAGPGGATPLPRPARRSNRGRALRSGAGRPAPAARHPAIDQRPVDRGGTRRRGTGVGSAGADRRFWRRSDT
jgi:serine/threonine-protein kinase